jgi:hypothetical protein
MTLQWKINYTICKIEDDKDKLLFEGFAYVKVVYNLQTRWICSRRACKGNAVTIGTFHKGPCLIVIKRDDSITIRHILYRRKRNLHKKRHTSHKKSITI